MPREQSHYIREHNSIKPEQTEQQYLYKGKHIVTLNKTATDQASSSSVAHTAGSETESNPLADTSIIVNTEDPHSPNNSTEFNTNLPLPHPIEEQADQVEHFQVEQDNYQGQPPAPEAYHQIDPPNQPAGQDAPDAPQDIHIPEIENQLLNPAEMDNYNLKINTKALLDQITPLTGNNPIETQQWIENWRTVMEQLHWNDVQQQTHFYAKLREPALS